MRDWQPAPDLLAGRVILLTGAGGGIGRPLAETLAAHGAELVLLDRSIPALEAVDDAIVAAGHTRPALYPMDFSGATEADYQALAETLEKEFGRLDGLVHNAALQATLRPLAHTDTAHWLRLLQVNLTAPFLLTRNLLGLLARSEDASVVSVSDEVAVAPRAYWNAYAVSKSGLETLTRIFAEETETNTGIRFNVFDPGIVRTPMRKLAYPAEDASRHRPPDDPGLMRAFLWLLSPESRPHTGKRWRLEALLGTGA
ncbi:MAG: SDR family NAD(P)-dependent oxidoreductase [Gammaproteobacteria bacterium]|nr:MAG: SDR family NAD(P)-dependent oxidoreductase [Gammaproteobacteria bacterium]